VEGLDQHLSPILIRDLATGSASLQDGGLRHLQECDHCSDQWWKLKQELKRKKFEASFSCERQDAA
jgi:hypothetical protein